MMVTDPSNHGILYRLCGLKKSTFYVEQLSSMEGIFALGYTWKHLGILPSGRWKWGAASIGWAEASEVATYLIWPRVPRAEPGSPEYS